MRKILSMILCVVMLMTLALAANAEALNMADGCKTDVTVKKANSAAVKKDGVIGAGEYTEVNVNRDPVTSDLLLSWYDGAEQANGLLAKAEELLANVHYYYSWDEVNGLNIAVMATLNETPYCEVEQPALGTGDDFIWQFGMMASIVENDDPNTDVINASVGYNTVTKTPLIGTWEGAYGFTGNVKNWTAGKNFAASVNGNTVVFEISYPIDGVLKEADRNGNIPNEGAMISTNVSVVSGNTGIGMEGANTYAVSLGDHGFMKSQWAGLNLSCAKTYFSHEEIPYTSAPATTPAVTTEPQTEIVTSHVVVTTVDEEGNVVEVTNEDGSKVTEVVSEVVTVAPTTTTPGQGTQAPTTGDPMIIAAVVAAISACGIVVAKKRK